jgi:hypothetical protein
MKMPPDNPEFARFTDALKTILKVPKSEINRRIEAAKTDNRTKETAPQAVSR